MGGNVGKWVVWLVLVGGCVGEFGGLVSRWVG